jgi:sulfur carrier protein
VNDEQRSVNEGCTVAQALQLWQFSGEQIAVAINSEFVPRSSYGERQLNDGDCIDIVAPVQGG